jgi:Na+-translocating ferredoxin:NAD+ oxidoreductase RnfC subunit
MKGASVIFAMLLCSARARISVVRYRKDEQHAILRAEYQRRGSAISTQQMSKEKCVLVAAKQLADASEEAAQMRAIQQPRPQGFDLT